MRFSATAPFEDDEQSRTAVDGTFPLKVMIQQLDSLRSQRQPTQFVSLAPHAYLGFGRQQILPVQSEYFART
jgi:hypothetical protein